jgi:hypothetical protein
MNSLDAWLLNRMAAYCGGGVPYREAARWTYGELLAACKGRHWRCGKPTKVPDMPATAALKRAGEVLREMEGHIRRHSRETTKKT